MNNPEIQTPASENELAAQVAALQRQMFMLLLVLLVVSLTLAAYLWYQDRTYHKEIDAARPQATQLLNTVKAADAMIPVNTVTNFLAHVITYGQRDPEFAQQVLKKYGINVTQAPPRR